MRSHLTRYVLPIICCLYMACTPKVVEKIPEAKQEVTQTTPKNEDLSDCPKFSDAPNPDQATEDYVLYRDFLKAGTIDQAFELWKKVYEVAPAADGKRPTVFEDGIYFYKRIYSGETDSLRKLELENTILSFFDEIAKCYGDKEWIEGRKAFDRYYTFGAKKPLEIYNQFKSYIDHAGMKTQAFAFNPFTALLIELHGQGLISTEEAQKYEALIKKIIAYNLENAKPNEKEAWEVVNSYAPERLTEFETVKGFYDCNYYAEKYYKEYLENPEDCDVILTILSRMKFGGCSRENSPKFDELMTKYLEKCAVRKKNPCYEHLQNAEYTQAVECFETKIKETDDNEEKAKYTLLIGKIYFSHLKNFSKARSWALKAAELKSGWGEPYMMIGRLYASSGPRCGSGRGWNSQVVTWVAIDMWNKAKRTDPSVSGEANKLIRRYTQFMPDKEAIFQRGLKEGSNFRVPCWIQRNTVIRAAP